MECRHPHPDRAEHNGVRVVACGSCSELRFRDRRGTMSPLAALAELFGQFRLTAVLPAAGAPGREALVYAAPRPESRISLRVLPAGRWWRAADGLWVRRDETHLLFTHRHSAAARLIGA